MNNKTELGKFRKLSLTSLIAGILTLSYIYLIPRFLGSLVLYLRNFIFQESIIATIIILLVLVLTGLPIAAVVCGSIDLKRIKSNLYSSKGKGMNITGIVLGSIYLFIVFLFLLGEIIFPH
ncbi:hypothetical protein ACFLQS_01235 [Actinomycetota bacterium]